MAPKKPDATGIEARLEKICAAINKTTYGGEHHDAVSWIGSTTATALERFPSGDPGLDEALGGGWPKGRFIELYGAPSSGKSTLTLQAIAEHQKKYPDEICALIDTEYTFDVQYAANIGVDVKHLLTLQPESGRQALNVLNQMILNGVKLIVVDSVAALATDAELEGDIGDVHVGEQARLMSAGLRTLTISAGQNNATVFWTNQVRDKVGSFGYGDKTTTPAGHALKHYASVRVQIISIGKNKEKINGEDVVVSTKTRASIQKNKTAAPFKNAEFSISFGWGIDRVAGIFDKALEKGVITKSGNTFMFGNEKIDVGRSKAMDRLRADRELCDRINATVQTTVSTPSVEAFSVVPSGAETDAEVDVEDV